MNNARVVSDAQRKFEGPFLVLGVLPSWPQELERRKDYAGPHTQLSSLFPIQALPAQPEYVDRLKRMAEPLPHVVSPGSWARRIDLRAKTINDRKLMSLLSALDRPRSAKQIARKLHISRPTVDVWLRALQQQVGSGLKIGAKGRKRLFWTEKK